MSHQTLQEVALNAFSFRHFLESPFGIICVLPVLTSSCQIIWFTISWTKKQIYGFRPITEKQCTTCRFLTQYSNNECVTDFRITRSFLSSYHIVSHSRVRCINFVFLFSSQDVWGLHFKVENIKHRSFKNHFKKI